MLSTRVFGLACAVAVFVCLVAAPVSAQPLDKRTIFTFSGPVTLPGVTLPGGQYLFRLADPNSNSNEFIFPKEQGRRLAMGASQPVLTTDAQTTTTEAQRLGTATRALSLGEES